MHQESKRTTKKESSSRDEDKQKTVKGALMEEAPSVSGRRGRVEAPCLGGRVLEGNRLRVAPRRQETNGRSWRRR